MLDIVGWKQNILSDDKIKCMIQVSYKDGRTIKTVLKQLSDWRQSGEGYSHASKDAILLFTKDFKSDYLWKKFLKQFPYRIVEKSKKNKEKVYNADKVIR